MHYALIRNSDNIVYFVKKTSWLVLYRDSVAVRPKNYLEYMNNRVGRI
jgi:hypothetical protein